MRHSLIALAALLTACAPTPAPSSGARSPVSRDSVVRTNEPAQAAASPVPAGPVRGLGEFVAAVPADDRDGICERGADQDGRALILLSFHPAGGPARNVGLLRDRTTGRVTAYSDLRGDLRFHGTGPKTTVVIDFARDMAWARNERSGARDMRSNGPASEAVSMASLGSPRRMIDMIHARCEVKDP